MENLEIILSLACTALGFLFTLLTVIVKFVKSAKAKKVSEQFIKITGALIPFIEQAEKFTAYSGEEKKEYVLTKANQFALVNKISFNEKTISEKIEELVALTKEVNARTKKASAPENWI